MTSNGGLDCPQTDSSWANDKEPPNFEDVYDKIGGFGKFQKVYIGLLLISGFVCGMQMYLTGLAFPSPAFRCKIADFEDTQFSYPTGSAENDLVSKWIPKGKDNLSSSCCIADLTSENSAAKGAISCPNGYVFDRSVFTTSANEDWNLVCGKSQQIATATSVFFLGVMIGGVIMGQISDRFGRLPTYTVSSVLTLVFGLAAAFLPNFWTFIAARFFVGFFVMSAFLVAFVLEVEMMGPKWRPMVGVSIQVSFAIGTMFMACLSYFIRDWRTLQWVTALPVLPFIFYIFFIPESPRWLFTMKRKEKLENVLQKASSMNGKEYCKDFVDHLFANTSNSKPKNDQTPSNGEEGNGKAASNQKANIFDLFNPKRPRLLLMTLNVCWIWLVNSLVYYGLTLASGSLGDDPFLNLFISGAVELPAYFLTFFAIYFLGRKIPLVTFLCCGGVTCLLTYVIPPHLNTVNIVLAMVGKLCISGSFSLIYVYSGELFPTPVRNVAVGAGSMSARIGGMLAPQIAALSSTLSDSGNQCSAIADDADSSSAAMWPVIIFGALSLSAGLTAAFLPETRGCLLPETFEEAETFRGAETALSCRNKCSCCKKQ